MKKIEGIYSTEIDNSLKQTTRQYLFGDLQKEQQLNAIKEKGIGIGITVAHKNDVDAPHYHTKITEYQYVLDGRVCILDIETGKEYLYKKGDFYVIYPWFKHVQKMEKGSRVIFVKSEFIDDKILVDIDDELEKWMNDYSWIRNVK